MKIDKNLYKLAKLFQPYAKLYIVGGYIRDYLLNLKNTDIDLCSSLNINEASKILLEANIDYQINNQNTGTMKIFINKRVYEYSSFRKEKYNINGSHKPIAISFVKDIKVDILRRDFTINSLYYDILSEQIIDMCYAQNDISNTVIRQISPNTLKYDSQRILRLVRFATKLNFSIEEKTFAMAQKNAKKIKTLSPSIIYDEFRKTLKLFSTKQNPFILYDKLKIWAYILGENIINSYYDISQKLPFTAKNKKNKLYIFIYELYKNSLISNDLKLFINQLFKTPLFISIPKKEKTFIHRNFEIFDRLNATDSYDNELINNLSNFPIVLELLKCFNKKRKNIKSI